MVEYRAVEIDGYGVLLVNREGTCVIGKSGKPLSIHWRNRDGYVMCRPCLYKKGEKKRRKNVLVHRLVATAFVDNPNSFPEVNHIDGNKENNSAENLEWCTRQYNVAHAVKMGLWGSRKGELNGRHKITQEQAEEIREMHKQNVSVYKIAKIYGIGWTTASHVVRGDTWV